VTLEPPHGDPGHQEPWLARDRRRRLCTLPGLPPVSRRRPPDVVAPMVFGPRSSARVPLAWAAGAPARRLAGLALTVLALIAVLPECGRLHVRVEGGREPTSTHRSPSRT
jgi:hypothetical protein